VGLPYRESKNRRKIKTVTKPTTWMKYRANGEMVLLLIRCEYSSTSKEADATLQEATDIGKEMA